MNIEWVSADNLEGAPWGSTYVLKTDMNVLAQSLHQYGWLSPIVVRKKNNQIIDGYHRWVIAQESPKLVKRDKGKVPVSYVDCDEIDAMILHVRLNRGRGQVLAKSLSFLVKQILRSKKHTPEVLMGMLAMSKDEMRLMMDGSQIKTKKIAEHQYSRAWIPVEAPANLSEQAGFIERPPNKDR